MILPAYPQICGVIFWLKYVAILKSYFHWLFMISYCSLPEAQVADVCECIFECYKIIYVYILWNTVDSAMLLLKHTCVVLWWVTVLADGMDRLWRRTPRHHAMDSIWQRASWRCFYKGVVWVHVRRLGPLLRVNTSLISNRYAALLRNALNPFIDSMSTNNDGLFQQDHELCHWNQIAQNYFQEHSKGNVLIVCLSFELLLKSGHATSKATLICLSVIFGGWVLSTCFYL